MSKKKKMSIQAELLKQRRADNPEAQEPLPSAHDETGKCLHCGSSSVTIILPREGPTVSRYAVHAVTCMMCSRVVRYVTGDGRVVGSCTQTALRATLGDLVGEARVEKLDAYLFGRTQEVAAAVN